MSPISSCICEMSRKQIAGTLAMTLKLYDPSTLQQENKKKPLGFSNVPGVPLWSDPGRRMKARSHSFCLVVLAELAYDGFIRRMHVPTTRLWPLNPKARKLKYLVWRLSQTIATRESSKNFMIKNNTVLVGCYLCRSQIAAPIMSLTSSTLYRSTFQQRHQEYDVV